MGEPYGEWSEIWITRPPCVSRTIHVAAFCPPAMQRREWSAMDYEELEELYSGKASFLHAARCKLSNMPVALKKYRKDRLSELNWHQVQREIRIHSRLNHDNIIQLYASFEDNIYVYLVQEYAAAGDLYEELKRVGGQFPEARTAGEVLCSCLHALTYLHSMGIIHRDIKPENILLDRNHQIKLADFGLSLDSTEERPVTRAGTLDYMSPEVLLCPEKSKPEENKEKVLLHYTEQVDAWAMGILAYELLVGRAPFQHKQRTDTYEHIMHKRPAFPSDFPEGARSFILAALHKSPKRRPSVAAMLQHPWILQHVPQSYQTQLSRVTSDLPPALSITHTSEDHQSRDGDAEPELPQTTCRPPSVFQWAGVSVTKHLLRLLPSKGSSDIEDEEHIAAVPSKKHLLSSSRGPLPSQAKPQQTAHGPLMSPFAFYPGGLSSDYVGLASKMDDPAGGSRTKTAPFKVGVPLHSTAISRAPSFHRKVSLGDTDEFEIGKHIPRSDSTPLGSSDAALGSDCIKAWHVGSSYSLPIPSQVPHKHPQNSLASIGSEGMSPPPSPATFSRASSASSIASPVASRRGRIAGFDSRIPPPPQGIATWQTTSPLTVQNNLLTAGSDPSAFTGICGVSYPVERSCSALPGLSRPPLSPFRSKSFFLPSRWDNPSTREVQPTAKPGVKRSLALSFTTPQTDRPGWT
eukprot:jgi/Botrbrau1/11063/Bobra.0302s0006.1